MTRSDVPPQDPGRSRQTEFGPQQFDNGAKRIEQGISMGQGTQALHEELGLMRDAAMQNGQFNLSQYKADVQAIDQKLHQDGYLPHIHIDVDGQGHDVVKRGGSDHQRPETAAESTGARPERHGHGRRHGHGGRHHGGARHHRRGPGRGAESAPGGEQSEESQVSSGDTLNEQELRPDDPGASRADRTQDSFDRTQSSPDRTQRPYDADPGKDRSARPVEPSLWGAPTISAAGIDKVLRENHSPAAGLGSYIYDQAAERGINPAFALAMYGKESTFGTKGAAVQNHSFGNIRSGPHGFKHYGDVKEGINDWMSLMSSNSYHGKSLAGVIHKYAPGSDHNDPQGYMRYVASNMNKWSRMGDDAPDNSRYA